MISFDFFSEGSANIFSLFYDGFSKKMSVMLYSINWPDFIARSALLIEILVNMCIAIVC